MGDSMTALSADNMNSALVSTKYNANPIDTSEKKNDYIDFSSYLKLLTAQMSNQDLNDPMSDSEFLQQMSSYSMLEAINQMNVQSNISYASSLVGKAVTVCSNGVYDTGIVESISVNDGKYYAVINGNSYETSSVSDVTEPGVYNELAKYIGKQVTVDDEGTEVTGKVTNVVITQGSALAVLENGKAYKIDKIKVTEESGTGTGSEVTATGDKTETTADKTEATETQSGSYIAGTLSVNEEAANYQAKAAAISESLWQTIDSMSKKDENLSAGAGDLSGFSENHTAYTNAGTSAGVLNFEDMDFASYASMLNSDNDELFTMTQDIPVSQAAAGVTSEYFMLNVKNSETLASNNPFTSLSSDTRTTSTRKFADEFPKEAEFADSIGSNMHDIRFINNTGVCSDINTDTVIGRTESGKAFTEIGFSGRGRLGEVVTWADGTQRVEIINSDGKSGYYTTSGNFTLDEICNFNCAPGSLAGKLTPFESAIRHFSKEYSAEEKQAMQAFANYISNRA